MPSLLILYLLVTSSKYEVGVNTYIYPTSVDMCAASKQSTAIMRAYPVHKTYKVDIENKTITEIRCDQ